MMWPVMRSSRRRHRPLRPGGGRGRSRAPRGASRRQPSPRAAERRGRDGARRCGAGGAGPATAHSPARRPRASSGRPSPRRRRASPSRCAPSALSGSPVLGGKLGSRPAPLGRCSAAWERERRGGERQRRSPGRRWRCLRFHWAGVPWRRSARASRLRLAPERQPLGHVCAFLQPG